MTFKKCIEVVEDLYYLCFFQYHNKFFFFSVCVCRSLAVRLETEMAELRRNLQQAVDHKLKAEREKRDAQDQVNKYKYTLDLSDIGSANNIFVFV